MQQYKREIQGYISTQIHKAYPAGPEIPFVSIDSSMALTLKASHML